MSISFILQTDSNDYGSDPNVAKYVRRAVIRPWLTNPSGPTSPRLRQSIWTNINEIIDPAYVEKETKRRVQKCLRADTSLILCALNAMDNIKEYSIEWNEESRYHPELYKACFSPMSQKWSKQLVKLSIKVPPQFLKALASIRLANLETFEYHFCTGQMSCQDISEMHNGFLVFVNNLKDSLECLSFVSTHTSLCLDITQIYKSLGPFPKLRSISLSIPFDGGHLSDPLVFVQFLEKHRSTLKDISVLTSRCTVHSLPTDPESINWIQKILTSVHNPFPRLRSLALAMRPLRAPLVNVSNFLEMHASTLDSLTLAERALDYREFERLLRTTSGPFGLEGLRHLRLKLNTFCPTILFYLASKMPGLTSLDIECHSIIYCANHCANATDFVRGYLFLSLFLFFFSYLRFLSFFLFFDIGGILQCNH